MSNTSTQPQTVDAIVLIGWMQRDQAVVFLRDHCIFDATLDEAAADALWQDFRSRVDALDPRNSLIVNKLSLDDDERVAAREFLRHFRGATNILDVIKVEPINL